MFNNYERFIIASGNGFSCSKKIKREAEEDKSKNEFELLINLSGHETYIEHGFNTAWDLLLEVR